MILGSTVSQADLSLPTARHMYTKFFPHPEVEEMSALPDRLDW